MDKRELFNWIRSQSWRAADIIQKRTISEELISPTEFPIRGTVFPTATATEDLRDGQVFHYTADAANGVIWTFRYRAASASGNKWEFVGGPPLISRVDTAETRAVAAAYAALATAGPSVTVPLTGDYEIRTGAKVTCLGNPSNGFHSYDIGGAGAVDADAHVTTQLAVLAVNNSSAMKTKALTAGTALVSKYKATANQVIFEQRYMAVLPVRVAG